MIHIERIRTIETNFCTDIGIPGRVPPIRFPVIQRTPGRPAVVRLPGEVRALKQEIGIPVITDNKDDMALPPSRERGEFAEIDTTDPVGRDLQCEVGLPLTFYQVFLSVFRGRLSSSGKRSQVLHQTSTLPSIIAHPENGHLKT